MARAKKTDKTSKAPKAIASTQSLSSFVKSICDVMRRSNCASALQYVPELTWILFLRILDAQETRDQEKAEAVGARCFLNGLVTYPGGGCADGVNGDNVMIAPPFVVAEDELKEIVRILDRSLTEVGL